MHTQLIQWALDYRPGLSGKNQFDELNCPTSYHHDIEMTAIADINKGQTYMVSSKYSLNKVWDTKSLLDKPVIQPYQCPLQPC